jgi:hypothetical protein
MRDWVDPDALLSVLRPRLAEWPRLFDLVCFIALDNGTPVGADMLALMRVPEAPAVIARMRRWFVVPLLVCLQIDNECEMIRFVQFMAGIAYTCAATVRTIALLIVYLSPMIRKWGIPQLLGLFVNEVRAISIELAVLQALEVLCVWNLICHPPSLENYAMNAEWSEAPFPRDAQADAPPGISLRTLNEIRTFLLDPPAFAIRAGVLLHPNGSVVQASLVDILNSLRRVLPESEQSRLFARAIGADARVNGLHRDIDAARMAFLSEFEAIVPPLMTEILEIICGRPSVQPNEPVHDNGPRQAAFPELSVRRSRAVCRGFPVAHSMLPPMRRAAIAAGGNCTIWSLGRSEEARIESDGHVITISFLSRKKTKVVDIDISQVWFRSDLVFEIWTTKHISYLVVMHEPPVPTAIRASEAECPWRSNFGWILALNRVSGRSFNDPECYPIFPCFIADLADLSRLSRPSDIVGRPVPVSHVRNLAWELERTGYIAPEFYCYPEAITQPLPEWAATPYDFVYAMRKVLESQDVTSQLPDWVARVWGRPGTPHVALFHHSPMPEKTQLPQPSPPAEAVASSELLVFAHRYGEMLWTVDAYGQISEFSVTDGRLQIIATAESESPLSDLVFFEAPGWPMIFDRTNRCIGGRSEVTIEGRLFCTLPGGPLYCPTACEIARSSRVIVRARARIVALAGCEEFGRAVYGTVEGCVHFVGLKNGRQIAEDYFGGRIDAVLITEVWGFVIARGEAEVAVYSINGARLRRAKLPSAALAWSSCASFDGFDFVAFACLGGEVGIFEAFLPESMKVCCQCSDPLLVHYERETGRVMVVRQSGGVLWAPALI